MVTTPQIRKASQEEEDIRENARRDGKDPDREVERVRQERLVEGTPSEGGNKVTGDTGGDLRP